MVGRVSDGMAKYAGKTLVVAPAFQGVLIRGAQIPKVDLIFYWPVATQQVCHG